MVPTGHGLQNYMKIWLLAVTHLQHFFPIKSCSFAETWLPNLESLGISRPYLFNWSIFGLLQPMFLGGCRQGPIGYLACNLLLESPSFLVGESLQGSGWRSPGGHYKSLTLPRLFPSFLKEVVVTSFLKKSFLDERDLANYCPNLLFLGKMME